ncbi:hypothetical protein AVEN_96124-1, partial [Araneus ventricosus]
MRVVHCHKSKCATVIAKSADSRIIAAGVCTERIASRCRRVALHIQRYSSCR